MINKLNLVAKRTISVFLSLMIVISTVSVCITNFIAFATTPIVNLKVNNDSLTSAPDGLNSLNSVVKSVRYQYKETPTSIVDYEKQAPQTPAGTESVLDALTNGTNAQSVEFAGNTFATGSGDTMVEYSDGSVFFDIIYTLNSNTDISDILVIGNSVNWKLSYKLYASKTYETLFDNVIYDHSQKAGGQHYEVENLTAKYVAMRVTAVSTIPDQRTTKWYNYYTRLSEFNVYGTPSSESDESEVARILNSNKQVSAPTTSAADIAKVQYQFKSVSDTTASPLNQEVAAPSGTNSVLEALTNGTNAETVEFAGNNFASSDKDGNVTEYTDGKDVYLDIIYTLSKKTEISDILVLGVNPTKSTTWQLSYKLYMSDKREDLFKGDPVYVHTDKAANQYFKINGKAAKYVAMRVIAVSKNGNATSYFDGNGKAASWPYYVRLAEFNVYGTALDEPQESEVIRYINSNRLPLSSPITSSAAEIEKVQYQFKSVSDATVSPLNQDVVAPSGTNSVLEALTNGTNAETVEFAGNNFATSDKDGVVTEYTDGKNVYLDIIYTLSKKTEISDILVLGVNATKSTTWQLSYKLYMSNKRENLFKGDPVYVHTDKAANQYFKLNGKSAKYVAMRIISVSTNGDATSYYDKDGKPATWPYYVRLAEFNVYGSPSEANKETEITRVINSDKLKKSPVTSGAADITKVQYQFKSVAEPVVTPLHQDVLAPSGTNSVLEALTNGTNAETVEFAGNNFATSDKDGAVTEYSDGKDVYLDIIYTLSKKTKISDIVVLGVDASKTKNWKLSYEIYLSDKREDLFKGDPAYVHTEKTSGQHYELKNITAKYVAMRIISVSTNENATSYFDKEGKPVTWPYYVRLAEFNVYGNSVGNEDEKEVVRVLNYDRKVTLPTVSANSVVSSVEFFSKQYGGVYTTPENQPYTYIGEGDSRKETFDHKDVFNALIDGTSAHTVECRGGIFATKDGNKKTLYYDGSVYYDIVYELNGLCDISDIVVVGRDSAWKLSYELYTSDNKYDLFKEAPIYIHKDKRAIQQFSLSGVKARYVAMRITSVTTEEENHVFENDTYAYYPRVLEFNVFGNKIEDTEIAPYLAETKEPLTYLSVVNKANAYYYNGKKAVKYEEGDIATLTDGSVDESDGMFLGDADITPFAKANGSKIKFYGNRELRIEYTLKGAASVSDIFIHSNLEKDYITQEYKLYASMKYEDLYNSPIYEFSNPGKNAVQLYDVNFKANYVALVITKPCTEKASIDSAYPSLLEFDVYGVVGDDYEPNAPRYPDTSKMDLSKVKSKYGKNLLKFKNLSYVERNVMSTSTGKTEQDKIIENFFKSTNNGKEHIDVPELSVADDKVTAFVFNLSDYDFTKVKGFAFQGLASNNTAHYTSHFKVFVAEEKEDLFLESNLVFEYKVDDETPIQRGVFYEIPKDECPVGRYIAFQIVKPYYTATRDIYPRISYLWAWGEEAIIPVNPTNLAENMPLDAYFAVGEDKDMVKESNLTAKEVANLTDGDTKTLAKINTKGNDCNTLELLYNLCNYAKIDEIAVDSLINKTTGFKTLKIYAADAIAAVYEDDAHVWTYNVSGNGNVVATKKFKEAITARYFRLVFEGTKDEVVLNEISIIGGDNQKFKTRNLNSTLTADNVSVTRTDLETGKTQAVAMNATVAGGLIDSSTASCIRLLQGVVGKDKYDITVHLGDLRAVSRIQLNFFDKIHSIYNPKSVNVYIGETYEEIFDEEAEPLFTISEDEINKGEYVKYLRPMLARYIRLELKEFNEVEYLVNEDGTYPITAVISDLIPFGTKVNGLQEDEFNEVMLEFADEDTNSKLAICKLDNSDIYTDVVNINVTENKATNWQMKSLENANLAIVDKTVYTFELVDLYGNKVTDINNRKIIISFEAPKSTDISKLVIGDAYKRTTVAPINTTISDDGKMVCAEFEWKTDSDNKFVLLEMITADDAYWENIGELEDFSEGTDEDLMNEHDMFWYDSIHTTDEIFTVTPVSLVFPEGLEFVATDISGEVSEEKCKSVISVAGGKQIAIYYDMKLYLNNEEYDLYGEIVDITLNPPASVTNNFTDLEVYHVDDYGVITPLWSETTADGSLLFQTNSFSDFVIVGNSINGGEQQGDSSNGMPYDDEEISDVVLDDFGTDSEFDDSQNNSEFQDQYENQEGASPQTGESSEKLFAIFAFMIAAAYVTFISAKKKEDE